MRATYLGATLALCFLLNSVNLASAQEVLLTVNGLSGEYDLGRVCAPIGDFNNDGKSNIIISSTAVGSPPQQILRVLDDTGSVLMTHSLKLNEYTSKVIGLGDVNADGTLDSHSMPPLFLRQAFLARYQHRVMSSSYLVRTVQKFVATHQLRHPEPMAPKSLALVTSTVMVLWICWSQIPVL